MPETTHDQCPSTRKGEKARPGKDALRATPRRLATASGMPVWRSIDELADTPAFREHLEREFPAGMAELVLREKVDVSQGLGGNDSRRDFLKLLGASAALAGVATIPGCRRPDHKIYAYSREVPEHTVPGKPLFYMTSMPRFDGGAEGLMVETHEGRPTKIEGNPFHPGNQGKASAWAIASIMALYDPDRQKYPTLLDKSTGRRTASSWDEFREKTREHFAAYDKNDGEGLAFLVEKNASPTRAAVRDRVKARWKKAAWMAVNPSESTGEVEGTTLALGQPMRPEFTITRENTKVIVSLDRDFLHLCPDELRNARQFATTRNVVSTSDTMSRLYVVESGMTTTGMAADHRLRLAPSRVTAFAVELAKRVLAKLGDPKLGAVVGALTNLSVPSGEDIDEAFLTECAFELLAPEHRGKTLVMAGPSQPAFVHALVALMNAALGNAGSSVKYRPLDAEEAASSVAQYKQLADGIKSGKVTTLVCVGANPAFDAPGDLGMAQALEKLGKEGMFVTLGVEHTETVALSTWALNQAHYLESWGDTKALDGTVAPIQPMIAPIFEPAYSEIEFLAMLADKQGKQRIDGYELVRQTWRESAGKWVAGGLKNDFETVWRRSLHQGVLTGSGVQAQNPPIKMDALPAAAASLGAVLALKPAAKDNLEVAFRVGNVADGRFSNVGWLQELPDVATRVVWDNPVLLSPKTALELGLAPIGFASKRGLKHEESNDLNAMYTKPKYPTARVAEVTLGGRSVMSPVWIMPGMADNTAILTLGYGRKFMGLIADGVGVNFSPLRSSEDAARGGAVSGGLTLRATGQTDTVISTQNHWTIDSKTSLLRAVDLPVWKKFGDEIQERVDEFYKQRSKLNFAERLGDLSHTPPNKSIYENPYNRSLDDPDKSKISAGDPKSPLPYKRGTPPEFSVRPQWAMTIDQSTCTGCGVCTIACQAENNIPVVGKKEVAKGREMTWIRVDRYYTGEDFNNPQAVHHQPVACVHCENAPCEVVCPVNATVHGPEGLNYMTYNRCIGTRYCANNCPYKVRRYNWFDYGVTKFNGGYFGKELVEKAAKAIPAQEGITGSTVHNRINPNLIPPRLREKLDEISRMQKNPDVTVRSRGVMEKCTFCIQRINTAKIECKLADIKDKDGNFVVPDGFFQTACQQACPSGSIVFGDQLDPLSSVAKTRAHGRSFAVLGYLNTRPRTSHMLRVMNPNPKLCSQERIKSWEDPFHHGHHHGHDHGHDHGHSFFDTTKQHEDAGYALSLRVLSTGGRA